MATHGCIGNPCWICFPKLAPDFGSIPIAYGQIDRQNALLETAGNIYPTVFPLTCGTWDARVEETIKLSMEIARKIAKFADDCSL